MHFPRTHFHRPRWAVWCRLFVRELFAILGRRRRYTIGHLFPVFALALSLTVRPSAAQDDTTTTPPTIGSITLGVENHYRLGCWTQIQVQAESAQAMDDVQLEILLPDGEGAPCTHRTQGIQLPVGQATIRTPIKVGRKDTDLTVRLLSSAGDLLASRYVPADEVPDAVTASQYLVLTLGENVGIAETIAMRREADQQRTVHANITTATGLPEDWLGYGGVHLVVLPTSENSVAAHMSPQQVDALKQWVQLGGRVLISAGAESEPLLQPASRFAELVPGRFDRIRMQRETSSLEGYAGKTRLALSSYVRDGDLSFRLPMAALRDVNGKIELTEGQGVERTPAVIRSSYGLGHVTFVAIALDLPPMAAWKDGRRRVVTRLLELNLDEVDRDENNAQFSQMTQIGFSDLTGQLRGALDQFSGMWLVPISLIGMLIGIYIVLIGPADFFLLRYCNQRFGWTWFTFPLVVLLACLTAWWLTRAWKGQTLMVNQASLIDVDVFSGTLRGTTWCHVFSPVNRKYNFQAGLSGDVFPSAELLGGLSSWQGLVGSNFGGMSSRQRQGEETGYSILHDLNSASPSLIKNLPIMIHGSRSLHGTVWGNIQLGDVGKIRYDMDQQLTGTIRNPLPVGLKSCQLFFGRRVYPLPSLAPGGSKELDGSVTPKAIDVLLTKKRVDQESFKDVSQPWDRKSFDVERILQMMMFHQSAGGKNYTSLTHRYQGHVDFSEHLSQERAVLIGQISQPGMQLLGDNQVEPNSETFVRIILPVARVEGRRGISSP